MKTLLLMAFVLYGFFSQFACINTTYSRHDEKAITNDLGHLIIGAFAHHGEAFYEHEIQRCLKILETSPKDFDARNDLGAAYTKVKNYEAAVTAFTENETLHPGRYETASNFGVLYKKMERYELAEKYIAKALEIKPGGHMGLGDYYLKMIRYRKQIAATEVATVNHNFLGVQFNAPPSATANIANREYLITLIKNDMHFAGAYLALGDVLFEEGEYEMALRAYLRVRDLSCRTDCKTDDVVWLASEERISSLVKHWESNRKWGHVAVRKHDLSIDHEIEEAEKWLESYQAIENELLAKGVIVTFDVLNSEAKKRGLEKPKMIAQGYFKGTAYDSSWVLVFWFVVLILIGGVFAFGVYHFLFKPKRAITFLEPEKKVL